VQRITVAQQRHAEANSFWGRTMSAARLVGSALEQAKQERAQGNSS
jgi:hypothetical protein